MAFLEIGDPGRFLLVAGVVLIAATLTRIASSRLGAPAQVGYLVLGLGLRALDQRYDLLADAEHAGLELFGELGIVALLFHVGLRSNPGALAGQLPRAATVWVSDVVVSAALGFAIARWALGIDLLPSLFVGTALSATSVGVSLLSWDEAGALHTRPGEFLLDLAELDDLSAVLLLVLLGAAAPAIAEGRQQWLRAALEEAGAAMAWMAAIGVLAWLFSRYLEERLTRFFAARDGESASLVVVLGFGMVIAAAAELAGFSAAVGALFAGLAFSRDPQAVRMDARFQLFYDLFTPFFFVGVGFAIDPAVLGGSWSFGAALTLAACVGKLAGAGLPSARYFGAGGALAIGASMMPRAEIAMVVSRRGLDSGAIPPAVYAGLVTVSAVTCLISPVIVRGVLRRWRPPAD